MISASGLIITAVILLTMGALGFALRRDYLRRVLAFNVMSAGAFLLLSGLIPTAEMAKPVMSALLILLLLVTTVLSGVALSMRNALERITGDTDPDKGDAS